MEVVYLEDVNNLEYFFSIKYLKLQRVPGTGDGRGRDASLQTDKELFRTFTVSEYNRIRNGGNETRVREDAESLANGSA